MYVKNNEYLERYRNDLFLDLPTPTLPENREGVGLYQLIRLQFC